MEFKKMEFKIHKHPKYQHETLEILKRQINNDTVEKHLEKLVQPYGAADSSKIKKLTKIAIELEKRASKRINLCPPGFEDDGRDIAEFLFKETASGLYLADAINTHYGLVQDNMTNKTAAILTAIDEGYYEKNRHHTSPPHVKDGEAFFALLSSLPITDTEKYNAIKLYYHFDHYCQYADNMVAQVTAIIQEILPKYQKDIDALMAYLDENLSTRGGAFFGDKFNLNIDDGEYDLYPGLINISGMTLQGTGFSGFYVSVGIRIFDFIDLFANAQSLHQKSELFLKTISDSTKSTILQTLKDGPQYGAELAAKLNCTSANVSHHMSALLRLDIVKITKENNRAYYYLDKAAIVQHLEDAKKLFM